MMDSAQPETEPQPRPSSPGYRRKLWICVLAAVLIALLCSLPNRQFRYQGKTFAEWYLGLTNYAGVSFRVPGYIPNPNPVVETLHIYGPNAVPFLRSEIRPDSAFRLQLRQFLNSKPWIPRVLVPRRHDSNRALTFVTALGPAAKDLVPDIARLFTNSATPPLGTGRTPKVNFTYRKYAQALAAMGPDGFPPLREALESPDSNIQLAAVEFLAYVAYDISPAIPSLLRCLDSSNPAVGAYASIALGRFLPQHPELVPSSLPHLIYTLQNGGTNNQEYALRVLGALGTKATSAVPVIQHTLANSPNAIVRKASAEALRRIKPEILNSEGINR